jgi:phage-related minor tail protein
MRQLAVLLSVTALAFAAAGCGGGDDGNGDSASAKAPGEWASSVCGALNDWVESLAAENRELGPAMSDTKDLKAVKEAFVTYLEDAEESFGEAVDKVDAAGPPDVPRGEAIQQDLVSSLEKVEQSFSNAADRANELSTSSIQSFSSGVGELSQDVQDNLATTGQGFRTLSDRFKSTELDNATDREPACQQFKQTR